MIDAIIVAAEFQNVQVADQVGLNIGLRMVDRVTHAGLGGQVDDAVDRSTADRGAQSGQVGYIRFVEDEGKLTGTGPIAKFFAPEALAALAETAGVKADGSADAPGAPPGRPRQ